MTVLFAIAPLVHASFYDDFGDGWWERDPNDPRYDANDPNWTDPNNRVLWDRDNPDWTLHPEMLGTDHIAGISSDSVADNAIQLRASGTELFGFVIGSFAASVFDGDVDANTGETWFDDTTDHYILAWTYYPDYYDANFSDGYNDPNFDPNEDDPNRDRGMAVLMLHANDETWTALAFCLAFDNNSGSMWDPLDRRMHLGELRSIYFDRQFAPPWHEWSWIFRRAWIDPSGVNLVDADDPNYDDPNDTTRIEPPERQSRDPNYDDPTWYGVDLDAWERQGFWMLFQFEQDPNYGAGDPNGKFIKGAIWQGGKYDWDGTWLVEGELSSDWWDSAPGRDSGRDWAWSEGFAAVAVVSDPCYANSFPAAVAYDRIEVRKGRFTNESRTLSLSFTNGHNGTVTVDPDLRGDLQVDANDPNSPRQYTDGTHIVLTADPLPGKVFSKWLVMDGQGQSLWQDANEVMYLIMDQDYRVMCQFKCGVSPLSSIVVAMATLGVGALVRRRSGSE